jgi:hypothetical protein
MLGDFNLAEPVSSALPARVIGRRSASHCRRDFESEYLLCRHADMIERGVMKDTLSKLLRFLTAPRSREARNPGGADGVAGADAPSDPRNPPEAGHD